jgi:hypothetical protein
MIDWSKQHCGVHSADYSTAIELMPDIKEILDTFPENPELFTWDVKVHMLMPNQYPCIPNWHVDNVPRPDGRQDFSLIKPEEYMYLWVSGPPLTEFRTGIIKAKTWIKFNQTDEHRGVPSGDFGWRGFIRASPFSISQPKKENNLRRHCQVYLDAKEFKW